METIKSDRIHIRCTPEDKQRWTQCARQAHRNLSDYIVLTLNGLFGSAPDIAPSGFTVDAVLTADDEGTRWLEYNGRRQVGFSSREKAETTDKINDAERAFVLGEWK